MRKILPTFAATIALAIGIGAVVHATEQHHDTAFQGRVVVKASNSYPNCPSGYRDAGDVCVADDVYALDDLYALDDIIAGDDINVTDDLTVTGESTFTAGFTTTIPATHLETIRFCGNGPDGATTTYMGPVLLDDTEADLAYGGAGCDALDNTTEATADAPWHAAFAFKPVAMVCVGMCTGASAANDVITFQFKDDTAAVAGMSCATAALGGDATPAQCTVRDSTPATVAAGSAIDVSITMTNDDCNDPGDDFECLLYVTF